MSGVDEGKSPERQLPRSHRPRSGSEKRQRGGYIGFRATEGEIAACRLAADNAGLTVSSYARAQTLAAPVMRVTRRPTVNKAALARLLGEIGRVGGNVNQIARQLNSGRDADEVNNLAVTLGAIWEMRDAVLMALGMEASTDSRPAKVRRLRQAELPQPDTQPKRPVRPRHEVRQLEEAN